MPRFLASCAVVIVCAAGLAADTSPAIQDALAALRRGDWAAAERVLQAEVRAHPADGAALTLLGVALDNEKKYQEAGPIHRRAAAAAPESADVWNNYANHLLGTGDEEGARELYERVVSLDPASFNANVQLAGLEVKQRKGADAVACLRRLPAEQQESPNLAPLRLAALYLAGESTEADALAARWLAASKNDLDTSFAIGVALADAGKLNSAETFFNQALSLAPSDFNVLFNLGVVEWHVGRLDRARELLETAERQQPQNIDLLYTLACVDQAAHRTEDAVVLAARAARLDPNRADVQKLLALATGDLGALDDSEAAWNRYLKLQPNDHVARRERGFTVFRKGRFEDALADLRWYIARHPDDAVAHFEIGLVLNQSDPAEALPEFNRALALQPDFALAHSARGGLYYQLGKPDAALPDLETAARLSPDDPASLDRLGQTYLALDRAADAVRVLRKAVELAPSDSKMLFHLARSLADAGQTAESKAAMDRFRQLGPAVNKGIPGHLVDYLSLTPEERHADYRRRVERLVRDHPADAAAQEKLLQLLLEDGEPQRAMEVAHKLAALEATPAVLADAGHTFLAAGQYAAAREWLGKAAAAAPSAAVQLELAEAAFHVAGPADGARLLDAVPESGRGAEYYLARAEMLDAAGNASEATASLDRALQSVPVTTPVYLRACAFLLRKGRTADALATSASALAAAPGDRTRMLLRAVALETAGRTAEALSLLEQVQNRWPEWHPAWSAAGIVFATHGRRDEACAALRTAVVLGAGPDLKRYLAALISGGSAQPPDLVALFFAKE